MTLNTTYVSNIRRLYQTNVLGSGVVEAHRSITQKRQGYTAYAVCPCVACIRESLFGGSTFLLGCTLWWPPVAVPATPTVLHIGQ